MNLFTIPAGVPFLDSIAAEWLAAARRRGDGPLSAAAGLILLPTRRAARSLAEAFLRVSGGAALLMPRIVAVGALDEAPLAMAGALDLPPAVPEQRRLAALSRLILGMKGADGAPATADRAWRLAVELASLMDEAERAEIDLAARLPDAAEPDYAAHWARTLEFLSIVTRVWPAWLDEQGLMNPAARQAALLRAQADHWEAQPPCERVLLAGISGSFPALARLAGAVARLPAGAMVLAGLDPRMDETVWRELEPSHPQAGLKALLDALGATRGDVREWRLDICACPECPLPLGEGLPAPVPQNPSPPSSPKGRGDSTDISAWLGRALLPGSAIAGDWMDGVPVHLGGLSRLEAGDQHEEAAAIALVLRDALETPGARAALVTPDRTLAGRVSAELLRWGIVADDSAGERLWETPPAVFLRLLARAVAEELAPVPLLALLKHPQAAAGLTPAACRDAARALEAARLRGPRPAPGLTGLRVAIRDRRDLGDFADRIERCLAPLLRQAAARAVAPAAWLRALIEAAEALAATDAAPGADRLWAHEDGEALAQHLAEVLEAAPLLPDQGPRTLPGLLDAVLAAGPAVRTRRALRGRDGTEHPRVFIWGLLEARLQSLELMVLGGLVEGVWPPATDPGPWLSRPMRARVGLPAPEEAIGQAAHDFVGAAMAAPRVVLSCPRRVEGTPTVPARWLTRMDMFLAGRGQRLPPHPAAEWVRRLDQPQGAARPVKPPAPRPAVAHRPRRLSVTEIETWLRDPYAIHARHVLKLSALRELDEDTDASDYGSVVHLGLHRFLHDAGLALPDDAEPRLREHLMRALTESGARDAVRNWWEPRLARIAAWVTEFERRRRPGIALRAILTEVSGKLIMNRPGGEFALTGRADRIERRGDGTSGIIDYKTGQPPGQGEVERGLAPQLPLEAAMARAGAFGPDAAGEVAELAYWRLSGGPEPGEEKPLFGGGGPQAVGAAASEAAEALAALVDAFDDPRRAYLSQPHPGRVPRFSDYAQLARVAEWSGAGEESE